MDIASLPHLTVVLDCNGHAWQRGTIFGPDDTDWYHAGDETGFPAADLARDHGPLRVVHQPS